MDKTTIQNRRSKREVIIVLCIFILALLVRIKFSWPICTGAYFIEWDDLSYYKLAISLIQTGRLNDGGWLAYRMPFFPMVLAVIFAIFGESPLWAFPFMAMFGALICLGTYFLGKDIFGSWVGIVAALLCSIDFDLIFYSGILMTETVFVFLIVCGLLSLERLRKKQTWQLAVIAGCFLGLATLTRVNMAPLVFVVVGWLIVAARPNYGPAIRNGVIIAGLVGSLWLAWIGRNYLELGSFVPFTTQGGNGYIGVYNDAASSDSNLLSYGHWLNVPLSRFFQDSDEVTRDQLQREQAFAWMRDHPVDAVKIALAQAVHFWQPGMTTWAYLLTLLVSMVGLVWTIRQGFPSVVLWALMAVALTAMSVVSIGIPRFRLILHPILAILSAYAFVTIAQRILRKRG